MPAYQTFRIGHGYDLHRLEPRPPKGIGRKLVIAGVTFPKHPVGPISHSDGDVVYHAVTDAILGALAEPDIGQLFPNSDPQFESANSADFLKEAVRRMTAAGYTIGNVDITVVCEEPSIGHHKSEMTKNINSILHCNESQVNIKGKSNEKVDAVGEGRAISAHVVVLLDSKS